MEIRNASLKDLTTLTEIEEKCFPQAEAASRKTLMCRLAAFPGHFWLLEEHRRVIAFVNGMVTNDPIISDEMYVDATLHNEQGNWQAIFGLDTLPEYRRQGCATSLMQHVIDSTKAQGRRGCILTCKKDLIPYYERFGYRDYGVSQSTHGGAEWYDMRLTF